ncbi:MAG: pectic acid lyase [Planctomycetales bacterium]|nr:pectic acid lyase [Planctomycetales bacterium]
MQLLHKPLLLATLKVFVISFSVLAESAHADMRDDALRAAKRAVSCLTSLSTQGGYLWRYAADLSLREGEGKVDTETIWVQPPGTPTIGLALVHLYEATRDEEFLEAALAAANALQRGQMVSGGWQAMVEFEPSRRLSWKYRTDMLERPQKHKGNGKDQSSLDDDKTQSALRFLIELDRATEFKYSHVHECATYGLSNLVQHAQFPNGGFPQVWSTEWDDRSEIIPERAASFPVTWERTYPGHQNYWRRPTLNDDLIPDVMRTLLLAYDCYHEDIYLHSALRAADFLILAQMPAPQPAWAQQYSFGMQPIWARKFEPPAISGWESQSAISALMLAYQRSGDQKYLVPIPLALEYLRSSELPDGRLARFYELQTNEPLYFNTQYELIKDDHDLPTHYGFKVANRLESLQEEYEDLTRNSWSKRSSKNLANDSQTPDAAKVREIVDELDAQGHWLSALDMRYHQVPGPVIDMGVAAANLELLADYLHVSRTSE